MPDIETMTVEYTNADGVKEYRYQTKPFVGMQLPDFIGYHEGVQLDIDDFGAFLCVTLDKPTKTELDAYGKDIKEIRLACVENAMWFTFRIGGLGWIDAPYTPKLSKNLHLIDSPVRFAELCRKITVVVIDTSTGTVGQVKEIALDDAFADTIFKLVYAIKAQPFDKMAYDDLLASVENTYSPGEIAEQSKDLSCIVTG